MMLLLATHSSLVQLGTLDRLPVIAGAAPQAQEQSAAGSGAQDAGFAQALGVLGSMVKGVSLVGAHTS